MFQRIRVRLWLGAPLIYVLDPRPTDKLAMWLTPATAGPGTFYQLPRLLLWLLLLRQQQMLLQQQLRLLLLLLLLPQLMLLLHRLLQPPQQQQQLLLLRLWR